MTMKNNLLILLSIWKNTSSLIIFDVIFLKQFFDLYEFLLMRKIY
jgi:hypothetical protein